MNQEVGGSRYMYFLGQEGGNQSSGTETLVEGYFAHKD